MAPEDACACRKIWRHRPDDLQDRRWAPRFGPTIAISLLAVAARAQIILPPTTTNSHRTLGHQRRLHRVESIEPAGIGNDLRPLRLERANEVRVIYPSDVRRCRRPAWCASINNKYSVAASAVGRPVEVHAYADRIVIRQDGRIVSEHSRSFGRGNGGGKARQRGVAKLGQFA